MQNFFQLKFVALVSDFCIILPSVLPPLLPHCNPNVRRLLTRAPLTQITEEVFPDMCWCPGLYPCPALCVCPWHSAEQAEMKEPLCWCQSQMPSTTTRPHHRLLCLRSPLTLSGWGPAQTCRWPHYQEKVCQWSCPGSVNGASCSWILAPLKPNKPEVWTYVCSTAKPTGM